MEAKSDWLDFVNTVTTLGELHERKVSPALVKMYWETLKGLTREEFDRAIAGVLAAGKFFPKPADILEAIHGTIEERAGRDFDKVWNSILGAGRSQNVDFGNPLIHHVIEHMDGGWGGLCGGLIKERPFTRQRFIEAYKAASRLPREQLLREAPVFLSGRIGGDCKTVKQIAGLGYEISQRVALPAEAEDRKMLEAVG